VEFLSKILGPIAAWGILFILQSNTDRQFSGCRGGRETQLAPPPSPPMGNNEKDTMAKVCRRFHSRMEAVVGANGDYFLIEWYIMPMTFIFFYFHKI
jgi:hypothetical protein